MVIPGIATRLAYVLPPVTRLDSTAAAMTLAAAGLVAAACPGGGEQATDSTERAEAADTGETDPGSTEEARAEQAESAAPEAGEEANGEEEPLAGGPGRDALEERADEALVDGIMDAHCQGGPPCPCPGTDVQGLEEYGEGARVDFGESEVSALVVHTEGCAPRHGPSLAIFRAPDGQPMATTEPELVEESFDYALGACRVVPFEGDRDALACRSGSTHQGQVFSSATLIAAVGGGFEEFSIGSYEHPGGSCLHYDEPVEAARLRDIEVYLYPGDRVVAELEVERARAEIPDEYDGDFCEAKGDGWELPELEIETDRFELRDGAFEPLND